MNQITCLLSLALLSSTALAEEPVSQGAELERRCTKGSDERVLTIVPKDLGCELYYQKGSSSEVVARSETGPEICEKVRVNIRSNLEKSGYVCK